MICNFLYHPADKKIVNDLEEIKCSLTKVQNDQSFKRAKFHQLEGFDNLFSLTILGTKNKGRVICKKIGQDAFQIKLIDKGHKYKRQTLEELDKQPYNKDELKELFDQNDEGNTEIVQIEEIAKPLHFIRDRVIDTTDYQDAISSYIESFLQYDTLNSPYMLIDGVPGSGKTLSVEIAVAHFIKNFRDAHAEVHKKLYYVAPNLNLLNQMKLHITDSGGSDLLDNNIIKLLSHDQLLQEILLKNDKVTDIAYIVDEVQNLNKDAINNIYEKLSFVVALGDSNQKLNVESSFEHLVTIKEAIQKKGQFIDFKIQKWPSSFRCPPKIVALAQNILKIRNHETKTRHNLAIEDQRDHLIDTNIGGVQFFENREIFLEKTIKAHALDVAFITLKDATKNELLEKGAINVLRIDEALGLEFKNIILLLDIRGAFPKDVKFYNALYVAVTRSTENIYLPAADFAQFKDPQSIEAIELITQQSTQEEYLNQVIFYLENNREDLAQQILSAIFKETITIEDIKALNINTENSIISICAARKSLNIKVPNLTHHTIFDKYFDPKLSIADKKALLNLDPIYTIRKFLTTTDIDLVDLSLLDNNEELLLEQMKHEHEDNFIKNIITNSDYTKEFIEFIINKNKISSYPKLVDKILFEHLKLYQELLPIPLDSMPYGNTPLHYHARNNNGIFDKELKIDDLLKLNSEGKAPLEFFEDESLPSNFKTLLYILKFRTNDYKKALQNNKEETLKTLSVIMQNPNHCNLFYKKIKPFFDKYNDDATNWVFYAFANNPPSYIYNDIDFHEKYGLIVTNKEKEGYLPNDRIIADLSKRIKFMNLGVDKNIITKEDLVAFLYLPKTSRNKESLEKVLSLSDTQKSKFLTAPASLESLEQATKKSIQHLLYENLDFYYDKIISSLIVIDIMTSGISLCYKPNLVHSNDFFTSTSAFFFYRNNYKLAVCSTSVNYITSAYHKGFVEGFTQLLYSVPSIVYFGINRYINKFVIQKDKTSLFSFCEKVMLIITKIYLSYDFAKNALNIISFTDYEYFARIIKFQDIDAIKLAIKNGIDVNSNNGAYTPLLKAIYIENIEIITLLIKNGADVNGNLGTNTPLLNAVAAKNIEMITLLIQSGADVNSNSAAITPLKYAIYIKNIKIITLLIKSGADVNSNLGGITPLIKAIYIKNIEIITLLIKNGADVNNSNLGTDTPLIEAINIQNIEIITLLIKNGADVNSKADNNLTPLLNAIATKNIEIITLLIQSGADVNSNLGTDTPLEHAIIMTKNIEIITLLIQSGADVNSNLGTNTPLLNAIATKNIEIITLLIKSGADVNGNLGDITPLEHAMYIKDIEIITLLIKNGADVNSNVGDITPLKNAIDIKNIEIITLLIKNGADVNSNLGTNTPLLNAIATKNIEIVTLLIKSGADVQAYRNKNDILISPLGLALEMGQTDIIKILVESGAESTNIKIVNIIEPKEQSDQISSLQLSEDRDSNQSIMGYHQPLYDHNEFEVGFTV